MKISSWTCIDCSNLDHASAPGIVHKAGLNRSAQIPDRGILVQLLLKENNRMSEQKPSCVHCERSDEQVPLIPLTYKSEQYWICPQHLPMAIHKPQALVGKLPGAENLSAGEH
jgi:hypothetical protein